MKISYPLTPTQHGMLMHSLRSPDAGTYVQQMVCALGEALDVSAFEGAWQRVVDRHAVLRTSFRFEQGDAPRQDVVPSVSCRIEQRDWRRAGGIENEQRLDAYLRKDRRQPFALEHAPLWRLCLFRLADQDYRLVWTSHHALLDGRSRRLLLEELFAIYEAVCQGAEPHLAAPPPYERYVRWLVGQPSDKSQDYWRAMLEGLGGATPLPMGPPDRVRLLPDHEDRHRSLELLLTTEQTASLRQLADTLRVTFNTLLQGAWALLLSRYASTEDVVFGATRACRGIPVEGVGAMVGLLINTLPVRVAVPASTTLASWLPGLRSRWVAMREHEQTPLASIQEWSELPPGEPLFDSIVVFENFRLDEHLRAKGGAWNNRSFRLIGTTNYPLVVSGHLAPHLVIELTYDRHRFDDDIVSRMRKHLQNLLEAFAGDPARTLEEFAMVSVRERRQLVVDWNPAANDVPQDACIHRLFEAQVARAPGATALAFEGQTWTYQELNVRANRLGHYLRTLGVGSETPVAICVERTPLLVMGLLGILKAGGAYVPLDPSYPSERLQFMLRDSRAPVLLTQKSLVPALPENEAQRFCLDTDASVLDIHSATNPAGEFNGSQLAYLMYTSGSTGTPKGVQVEHRSVVRLVIDTNYIEIGPTDCMAQMSNTSFDAATFEIWGALLNGAKLAILGRDLTLDPARVATAFREEQITISFVTTQLFNHIVSAAPEAFAGLRCLLTGGEAPDPARFRDLLLRWPPRRVVHVYGPTETTTFATFFPVEVVAPDATTIPIGRAIANTSVFVLDPARGLLPVGVAGELYIGGAGVARGYLARPELTAEKFVQDPFSDQSDARLYRTGDLVRWRPDGNLEFLGRFDQQIKLRGFRIEPGEIETALAQHPQVEQAVVILREDRPGERRLAAYIVVGRSGAAPAAADLRKLLQKKLPDYMVPSAFVFLDALPLSPNGKLDRQRLPAPDPGRVDEDRIFVPPRTPTEERVAAIFAQLLGRDRVGVHDDFFEMSGDSLLAIQAASRVRQALGIELPLTRLFETPTVARLVANLDTCERSESEPGVPALVATAGAEPSPLSCSQLSIWDLHERFPNRVLSNTCRAHRLKGRLIPEAVRDALQSLLERHEAFRTTFSSVNGIPRQFVSVATPLDFPVLDLSGLPESQRMAEVQRLYEDEKQRRYDLARDVMLRAMLVRLGADDHVLVLNLSHIVSDARSMAVFYREFPLLYDAFANGKRVTLPALSIQPRDFARWEGLYLQAGVGKRQIAFWTKHLACGEWASDPLSHATPVASDDHASLRQTRVVANACVDALQEVGRQEGCTLAMTLFALTNVQFHMFTGREDILLGAPFAARTRPEIDELIGVFPQARGPADGSFGAANLSRGAASCEGRMEGGVSQSGCLA